MNSFLIHISQSWSFLFFGDLRAEFLISSFLSMKIRADIFRGEKLDEYMYEAQLSDHKKIKNL